jgi:hypothetical protein
MSIIKFNPTSKLADLTVPHPKPAREYVPQWYKSMPAFQTDPIGYSRDRGVTNRTQKMCMPFADALTAGYIQETWQDINIANIEVEKGKSEFVHYTPVQPDILSTRSQEKYAMPIPEEYYPFELTWHPAWVPELPKGYSAIITQPFNRTDLPFYTLTGVVDADTFTQSFEKSQMPFFLKKSFTGIIPIGTPMYQIIPIKREDWTSIKNSYNEDSQITQVHKLRQHFWGGYKKHHWVKKNYS